MNLKCYPQTFAEPGRKAHHSIQTPKRGYLPAAWDWAWCRKPKLHVPHTCSPGAKEGFADVRRGQMARDFQLLHWTVSGRTVRKPDAEAHIESSLVQTIQSAVKACTASAKGLETVTRHEEVKIHASE